MKGAIRRALCVNSAIACISIATEPQHAMADVDPQIHEKCLRAADYSGCVNTQTYGAKSPNPPVEPCDKYNWCIAGKGRDSLGMEKIEGWMYKTLVNGDVKYEEVKSEKVSPGGIYERLWYAIPHKGEKRYVGYRTVRHSYDTGSPGSPGYRQTFGPNTTSCSGYGSGGLATIFCNTTPPMSTYVPGTSGRPAGFKREFLVGVFDCKDRSDAIYEIGGGIWKGWQKRGQYDYMPKACEQIDELEVLPIKL